MDEIVKQAIVKWPNVPHCYGWLALDARGAWRLRDERAQALALPGDRLTHAGLVEFINRNYTHDDAGRWYFQNGPQRVYVDLAATPYIARTDPAHEFVLHTDQPLAWIDAAWLTEAGQLVLQQEQQIALVDDRDMAQCMARLEVDGKPAGDDYVLAWLNTADDAAPLALRHASGSTPLRKLAFAALPARLGFVRQPQPDGGRQ